MRQADSFDEFLKLIERDVKYNTITVAVHVEAVGVFSYSPVTGPAADHSLALLHTATGRWGRKLVYRQHLMRRMRSARGIADVSPMQRRDDLMCYVTANQRVQELQERFPDRAITLIQGDGTFDPELHQDLMEEADKLSIVPAHCP